MLNTDSQIKKKPLDYLTTYGLWLITAVLAVWEIAIVRNVVLDFYARFLAPDALSGLGSSYWRATSISQWAVLLLAVLAIVIIIGGFEYHHRRVGETKSLKVLGWTLGIQVFLLALALIV